MKQPVYFFDCEMNYPAAFGMGFYIPSVSYEIETPDPVVEEEDAPAEESGEATI